MTAGYIGEHQPITSKKGTYLTVNIEKFYIPYVRYITGKFYAAMYGRMTIPCKNGEKRSFQIVDGVAELKELDADHLDRIIQGPYCLMDDAPYFGGGVDVAVSLFAVHASDIAAPYITLLKGVAKVVEGTLYSTISPLADVLEQAMKEFIGKNTLEIGRFGMFRPVESGYYVIARLQTGNLPLEELVYEPETRRLLHNGYELTEYPYFVLSFTKSSDRENRRQIPEVAAALKRLVEQINSTPDDGAANMAAFNAFKRVVILSPDLLMKDIDGLIEEVHENIKPYLADLPGALRKQGGKMAAEPSREVISNSRRIGEDLKELDGMKQLVDSEGKQLIAMLGAVPQFEITSGFRPRLALGMQDLQLFKSRI
ncbi:MAG: hypothetical protein LLF96_00675 [Eubacteriales bacterium]|nr:hypothetical protein [Eubacteriales bacterium]